MKCDFCDEKAIITMRDFAKNKEIKLCKKCARKKDIIMDEDIEKTVKTF